MPRILRPTRAQIAIHLASKQPLTYLEVGASAHHNLSEPGRVGRGYDVDRHEFSMGTGRDRFERTRDALIAWRHFEIPWLSIHGADTPAAQGQVVATLVRVAGLWFLNPCQVVYTEFSTHSPDRTAFAYGTLPGHAECGEERFEISFDASTQDVTYTITAFSRPASLLPRLGYPIARRLQRRFAASSAQALRSATE